MDAASRPDPSSPAARLCLSCGLCCDGSLYTAVRLAPSDSIADLQAAGLPIRVEGERTLFPQPCTAHQHGCCQIYAIRPYGCQQFRCRVLAACEDGSRSWEDAEALVARVLRLRVAVLSAWATIESPPPGAGLADLQRCMPADAEMTPAQTLRWAPVLLPLGRLRALLQDHFLVPAPSAAHEASDSP